jgi:hypothetical protein
MSEDGEVMDAAWPVLTMGDRSSSTNHYIQCVIPRMMISRLLDPMSRHTHVLNAPEHAYKSDQPDKLGGGRGVDWRELRAVDSDEDESEGDNPLALSREGITRGCQWVTYGAARTDG